MSTEERLLKLENAVLTLSELAVKVDARDDELEKNFRMLTELVVKANERMDKADERADNLENHFRVLTDLAVSANERMDTHTEWINTLGAAQANLIEGQANLDAKVAALTDAQIRTEEALAALTLRVDKLADTVERHIEGNNGKV
jgi:uncharacterized phage infection (PIP) family protein YhgE